MTTRGNGDAHTPPQIAALEALETRTLFLEQATSAQRESIEWLVHQIRALRDDTSTIAAVLTRVDLAVAQLAQHVARFRAEVVARLAQINGGSL